MSLSPALLKYQKKLQLGRIKPYQEPIVDNKTTEERIFGWLPDVVKQGYNESITGLSRELAIGKKPFEIEKFDQGVLGDIGAGLISFFMPADLALTVGSGGLGSIAAKSAIKRAGSMATKQLARGRVKKETADFIVNQGTQRVFSGASGFGSYSGISNALRQKIETSEINFDDVLTETGKGALLGAVTGGIGARAVAKESPEVVRILQEGTVFGGLAPVLEGQSPTPQDFVNSIGTVMGLRGANMAVYLAGKKAKGQLAEAARKELEPLVNRYAKDQVNLEAELTRPTDLFVSRTNAKDLQTIQSVTGKGKNKKFNLLSVEGNKKSSLSNEQFRSKYKAKDDRDTIIKKYELFESETGYTEAQIQNKRRISAKLSGRELPRNKKIDLEDLTSTELLDYSRDIKADFRLSQLRKRFSDLSDLPTRTIIEHVLPKSLSKFVMPGGARAKSLPSKIVFDLIDEADIMTKRTFERFQAKIDVEFKGLKTKDFIDIADGLENKSILSSNLQPRVNNLRKIYDEMYEYARSKGIKVADYRSDYFPQIIKKDIANIIGEDMISMVKKRQELLEMGLSPETVKDLNKFIQASLNRDLRRDTSEALQKIVKNNKGVDFLTAFKYLQSEVITQQLSPFGNLEKTRKLRMPESILERDAYEVMTAYNMKLSKRVELASRFGLKGEVIYGKNEKGGLLRDIAEKSYEEKDVVKHVFDSFTGYIESDPFKNYSPRGKRLANNVMAFEMATKIALGTATIPNVTQLMISTALEAGYFRTMKGALQLFRKDYREKLKSSGLTYHNAMDVVLGTDFSLRDPRTFTRAIKSIVKDPNDRMLKIANVLATVSQFKRVNYLNNMLAASTAEIFIKDLHRIARTSKNAPYKRWAINNLKRFKIDHNKKLSDDQISSGMLMFARDSQLQKNVLKDPLAFNNPRMRPFFIFKRFGYRQLAYLSGVLKREVLEGKNILPIVRLGLGGMLGASAIDVARRFYIKMLTGDETYKEDKEGLDALLDGMQTVGAMGFFGDILEAESKIGAVGFAITPVVLSDLMKVGDGLLAIEKNIDTFGYGEVALRRGARAATPVLGSVLGRKVARAIETPQQKLDILKQRKGRVRSKILDLIIEGKKELALKNIKQWNSRFPEQAINPQDINFSVLYNRVLQKRRRIAREEISIGVEND